MKCSLYGLCCESATPSRVFLRPLNHLPLALGLQQATVQGSQSEATMSNTATGPSLSENVLQDNNNLIAFILPLPMFFHVLALKVKVSTTELTQYKNIVCI